MCTQAGTDQRSSEDDERCEFLASEFCLFPELKLSACCYSVLAGIPCMQSVKQLSQHKRVNGFLVLLMSVVLLMCLAQTHRQKDFRFYIVEPVTI